MRNLIGKLELELLHTPETTTLGKIKNIIFGAAAYIMWATFILFIYKSFIPEFGTIKLQFMFVESTIHSFISMCILAPLVEEVFFRKPLSLLKKFEHEKIILLYVLFSSTLFGYIHSQGAWSVPIQGVAGLLFCYVYLKNGYSYISSVACHFLVNFYYFLTTN